MGSGGSTVKSVGCMCEPKEQYRSAAAPNATSFFSWPPGNASRIPWRCIPGSAGCCEKRGENRFRWRASSACSTSGASVRLYLPTACSTAERYVGREILLSSRCADGASAPRMARRSSVAACCFDVAKSVDESQKSAESSAGRSSMSAGGPSPSRKPLASASCTAAVAFHRIPMPRRSAPSSLTIAMLGPSSLLSSWRR